EDSDDCRDHGDCSVLAPHERASAFLDSSGDLAHRLVALRELEDAHGEVGGRADGRETCDWNNECEVDHGNLRAGKGRFYLGLVRSGTELFGSAREIEKNRKEIEPSDPAEAALRSADLIELLDVVDPNTLAEDEDGDGVRGVVLQHHGRRVVRRGREHDL